MAQFEGSKLRLARHYWGKTLGQVAEDIERSRQYVSQLETGKASSVSRDVLESLAHSLNVTPDFFCSPAGPALTEDQAHFRSLASTKVSTKLKVLARGTIFDQLARFIDERVALPDVNFPDYSGASTPEEIERAAEKSRLYWGLGLGPIDNMVKVVEHAGALVTFFRDASQEVDALSIPSIRPIIVRNDAKESPFRQRFDIAHEMAHLILHEGIETGDRKTETEANRLASAFLLPRSTFAKVFKTRGRSLDWHCIVDIKMAFGVSKAAILYRAKVLGLIDERQYKSGVIFLKNTRQSKKEDEDDLVEKERADLLSKSFEVLSNHHGLGFNDVASALGVQPSLLRVVISDVVEEDLIRNDHKIRRPNLKLV
ncbi:XRE family transcriptional regulator [Halomonas sp. McH1-25]|nr:XRE family transcriptional regulator [Halomonas sp. McH1-25]MCP1366977.1 XRE family transcriptional regulator [Halomonas sp. BBD48]